MHYGFDPTIAELLCQIELRDDVRPGLALHLIRQLQVLVEDVPDYAQGRVCVDTFLFIPLYMCERGIAR